MTDHNPITTLPYRLTPATYLRIEAGAMFPIIVIAILLLAIIAVVASAYDIRWFFVSLMVFFLVIPAALAHIIYSRLLTPEATDALAIKKIAVTPGSHLDIIYLTVESRTDSASDAESEEESDMADDEPVYTMRRTETIDFNLIERCEMTQSLIKLHIKNRHLPLCIPSHTLPPQADPYLIFAEADTSADTTLPD